MTMNWDDLRTVLALVRHRTLSGAGSALGLNYTTVARRISRAEDASGAVLFERLADGYRPTDAGLSAARHAEKMEEAELALSRDLAAGDETLSGPFIVTAPQLLIGPYLAAVLAAFKASHPAVELEIRATNDLLDLNRREADLALRISREPGDDLMGLRLATQETASFATPSLAAQIEADPKTPIPWIMHVSADAPPKKIDPRYPNNHILLRFDDMIPVLGATRAGLGVARLPMFLGRSEPGLVQIPLLAPQAYADIWLVGHRDIWRSAKSRKFREFLLPEFRARRSEFLG